MFNLKIKNAVGIEYDLTTDPRFSVINIDGLNPPPVSVNTSANAGDGSSFNSAYVQGRNIVITVVFNGDIESTRKAFYKIFPMKKPLTFLFTNKNREVKITGYAETIDIALFSQRQQAQVSIVCPNPWLESAEPIDFEPGYEVPTFEPPFSIEVDEPIPFSEVVDHPTSIIVNRGDSEVGLIAKITFTGAVTGFRLTNETTGDYFKLDYSFQSGDVLTLDTRHGKLSVKNKRSSSTFNILMYVTSGSKWVKLPVGVNRVGITAESGLSYIGGELSVSLLYGGV